MQLKNIIGIIFLVLSFTVSAATNNTTNVVVSSEKRMVPAFTGLSIKGDYIVTVTNGQPLSLTLMGASNVTSKITTEVKGDTLYIRMPSGFSINPTAPIKIVITVPQLQALSTMGASTVTVDQLSGSDFSIATSGKQTVALSGNVNSLNVNLLGVNKFDAQELKTHNVNFNARGLADCKIYADKSIHANTAGSIVVKLYGNPKEVATSMAGGGQLVAGS